MRDSLRLPSLHFIITSSGGSGHESASREIQASPKWHKDGDQFFVVNTIKSGWYAGWGPDLGSYFDPFFAQSPLVIDAGPSTTRAWDWAQRTGRVEIVRLIAWLHKVTPIYIPVFRYKTYKLLTDRKDLDLFDSIYLHNTQPVCTGAIIESVARYNRENPHRKVRVIHHFTDLPTEFTAMLIKEVSDFNSKYLQESQFECHTCPPAIDISDLTEAEILERRHAKMKEIYPQLYAGLSQGDAPRVKFNDGPIRTAFISVKEVPARRENGVDIFFPDFTAGGVFVKSGKELLHKTLEETFATSVHPSIGQYNNGRATVHLTDKDEIISIMLGSQASVPGTLAVLHAEIENAKAADSSFKKIFVFCSNGIICYEEVMKLARITNKQYSSGVAIIPLNNQPDSTIANIYSMADKIVLRPGGLSIMEAIAATTQNKKAKIICYTELSMLSTVFNYFCWIFGWSEDRIREYYCSQPMHLRSKELIAWEEGNAEYISHVCLDQLGLSRVRLANMYTYGKELSFFKKLDQVKKLLADTRYLDIYELLLQDKTLNTFVFTSNLVENKLLDIACIVEIITALNNCIRQLEVTISNNPGLDKLQDGPRQTLELISSYKSRVEESLNSQKPQDILAHAKPELQKICQSFNASVTKVRHSWFTNLQKILQSLKKIYTYLISTLKAIFSVKKRHVRSEEILSEVTIIDGVLKLPVLVACRMNQSKPVSEPMSEPVSAPSDERQPKVVFE